MNSKPLKSLKSEIYVNNISNFRTYFAVNMLCLQYEDQQVNALQGNNYCYENHMKHMNTCTLCWKNSFFFSVTGDGTYGYHSALKV